MRKALIKLVILILSVSVIIGGSGFSFSMVSCQDCGTTVMYKKTAHCCGAHEEEAALRFECCDVVSFQLSTDSGQVPNLHTDACPAEYDRPDFFSFREDGLSIHETPVGRYAQAPMPPPGGRRLLQYTSTLLI